MRAPALLILLLPALLGQAPAPADGDPKADAASKAGRERLRRIYLDDAASYSIFRDAERKESCQDSTTERTGQNLSLPRSPRGLPCHGAGLRQCLRGFRVAGRRRISTRGRLPIVRTRLVALLGHVGTRCKRTKQRRRTATTRAWPERYRHCP